MTKAIPIKTAARRAMYRGGLAAALTLAPGLAHAGLVEVGTAAAANPDAICTPPGARTRDLIIGTDVFFEERIQTQANGARPRCCSSTNRRSPLRPTRI